MGLRQLLDNLPMGLPHNGLCGFDLKRSANFRLPSAGERLRRYRRVSCVCTDWHRYGSECLRDNAYVFQWQGDTGFLLGGSLKQNAASSTDLFLWPAI